MSFKILKISTFTDLRGSLTVLDGILPFSVVRTYWIYHSDGSVRGGHRHHHTQQALVSLSGTVDVFMDDGHHRETILLDSPDKLLIVEPKDWHTMTFREGSILLVFSSHPYNPNDYIDAPYDHKI